MKKIFFVPAAVIFSMQLWAQSANTDTTKIHISALDPVVVTATKFPLKTSQTGKVILVINKEALQRNGGKDLSQILSEQAGITIAGAGSNPGKEKIVYLRGAAADKTLICIDGVPIYDPSGIGGNFDLRNISVDNIERIEILKGAQSTLYGSDAVAGVINIITRSNSAKKMEGNSELSYGSWQTFSANAGIKGKADKIAYTALYSFHTTNGINEAVNNNPAYTPDKDGLTQNNLFLNLAFKPIEKFSVQPFLRYSSIKGAIDQGAFTDELDYTYTQKSWQSGINSQYTLKKSKIYFNYNYNNIDRIYIDDSIKSRNGFDIYAKGTYKGHEHFVEAYTISDLSKILKLTAGLDFRSTQSDQEYLSISAYGPYSSKYSNDSLRQNQASVYAALNVETKNGFSFEAGGRINFHSAYGNKAVFSLNPSYLINKKVKIFFNLASAYRTPSLYQLYSEYGNKKLKPEAGITSEAGVQFFPDTKWMARATYFNRDINNVIFFFTNPVTYASQYINQDKQKDHGLELELNFIPSSKLSIKGFYTYVAGKITTKKGITDTTYNNLLRRPKNSFGLNLGWQANNKLYFNTHLSVAGERKDSYYDNTTFSVVNTTLKSYALLDLYVEYSVYKNKLKIFSGIRNALNTQYTEISGFNTQPFNATFGLRYKF